MKCKAVPLPACHASGTTGSPVPMLQSPPPCAAPHHGAGALGARSGRSFSAAHGASAALAGPRGVGAGPAGGAGPWRAAPGRRALASSIAGAAVLRCAPRRHCLGRGRGHGRSAAAASVGTATPDAPAVLPLQGPAMRVVVFGPTGYIGKAVVKELADRGHSVLAFTRKNSGIGGKQTIDDVKASFSGIDNIDILAGDVTQEESVRAALASLDRAPDAAICCLASRTGGREDSFDIDYKATVHCMRAARGINVSHFVLLSAICVQRPLLAFQEAKLLAESELKKKGEAMTFSIVQPTAFFKSLVAQVQAVKAGSPYVMFGDGTDVRCKPISEEDLASFIADCLWDPAKKNAVLPVGGPGPAMSFKEQGDLIFELLGREPSFISVPYAVFDAVQAVLDFVAGLFPDALSDVAEYGRIGRYYAEQSMLVLDPTTGNYSEKLTPSYGKTTLRDFLTDAVQEGNTKLQEQQLGEQNLLNRVGLD